MLLKRLSVVGEQEEYSKEVCEGEDIFSVLDMKYIDGDSSYSIIINKDNIVLRR